MLVISGRRTKERVNQAKAALITLRGPTPYLDDTNMLLEYIDRLETELAYNRWLVASRLGDSEHARTRFRSLTTANQLAIADGPLRLPAALRRL
jgi:hypothetical protein